MNTVSPPGTWHTLEPMLSEEDKQQLLARVATFEANTGIQLVTTLQPRCDDYPEIPWKAFAAGTAIGTLVIGSRLILDAGVQSTWAGSGWGLDLLLVLGFGLGLATLTLFVSPVARWFLSPARADVEVRQAAQSLFLEHELFGTRTRTAVLILIATFEHRVVVLADRGLRQQLPTGALDDVVTTMVIALHTTNAFAAFSAGMDSLESLLRANGIAVLGESHVLPDHLDTHRGEGDAC